MQPRVLLSCFTSRDIAGSCQSWCPPGPPHPSLQRCLWVRWPLAFSGAWGFSSPEQDFTLSLVKPHSPFLLPGEVPLDVSTTFWCTWCSSQFCTSSKPGAFPQPEPAVEWHHALVWANCSSEIIASAAPARAEPPACGAVGTKRPGQESGLFTLLQVKLQLKKIYKWTSKVWNAFDVQTERPCPEPSNSP